MTANRELVFVYGTLRRGGSNHFRMEGAEFIAPGTVRGRLYRIDWFPGLLPDAAGEEIHGEVFAAGPEQMAALDAFEGPEYKRTRVPVNAGSGETIHAWLWEWLGPVDESQRIAGGDWLKVDGV